MIDKEVLNMCWSPKASTIYTFIIAMINLIYGFIKTPAGLETTSRDEKINYRQHTCAYKRILLI